MKIEQTMPVILKDLEQRGDLAIKSFILFARSEAERIEAIPCSTETEADMYLHEFERSGTLRLGIIDFGIDGPRYEIIEPVIMVKANYVDGARKHFRVVEMDDPNLIEAEADIIKGLED